MVTSTPTDMIVFGTGSLVSALLVTLASMSPQAMSVLVAGRNADHLAKVAFLARARAAAFDQRFVMQTVECDFEPTNIRRLFERHPTRVVVVAASLQSPWTQGTRWDALLKKTGFGFTLPLQAILAERVIVAARETLPTAHCVNACYPDAVNMLLSRRGVPVTAGLGNIAILAAAARASRGDGRSQHMTAHHAHLSAVMRGEWAGLAPPLLWLDGLRSSREERDAIVDLPLPTNEQINVLTAASSVPMLLALAARTEPWRGHAPGIQGLPGGYPVTVCASRVEIDLPAGLSIEDAIQFNREAAAFDGLSIGQDGTVQLTQGQDELERLLGVSMATRFFSWHASEATEVAAHLMTVRAELSH